MTILRHNVFAKPNAGLAASARPNVLVGHFPREGKGAEDDYAIHGNFFYQNRNEALFQGEGNVALYGNLFVNAYGDAVRIQPHNDIPRRLTVAFNTVLARGAGIVRGAKARRAAGIQQDVFANAVFAGVPLGRRPGARATSCAPGRSVRVPPPAHSRLRANWICAQAGIGRQRWLRKALPANAIAGRRPVISMGDRAPRMPSGPTPRSRPGPGWLPGLERKPGAGPRAPWSIMPNTLVHANIREHHAEQQTRRPPARPCSPLRPARKPPTRGAPRRPVRRT